MAQSGSSPRHWLLSVETLVAKNEGESRSRSYVYPVPHHIRTLKPKCYQHLVLPLGLYNWNFENVTPSSMDRLKLDIVRVVVKSLNPQNPSRWKGFCQEVLESPPLNLNHFYGDLPSHDLNMMRSALVIDAVFVAAVLLHQFCAARVRKEEKSLTADAAGVREEENSLTAKVANIFTRASLKNPTVTFIMDICFLFENQIPLLLVGSVWKQIERLAGDIQFGKALEHLVHITLESAGLPYEVPESLVSSKHLLECMHSALYGENSAPVKPHDTRDSSAGCLSNAKSWLKPWFLDVKSVNSLTVRSVPTASQLRRAGIRFKGVRMGVSKIQLEKSFFGLRATLLLPMIELHDLSERILLNLCAYEMMNTDNTKPKWFMAYVDLLDDLIDSEADVQLLRKGSEPVITASLLRDEKRIADLFSNLLEHYDVGGTEKLLAIVREDIRKWHNTRWRHQLTHFTDRFVTAPWIFWTMIVAAIILIATVLSTIYTVLEFYRDG